MVDLEVDRDRTHHQWMTQRDEIRRPLGSLNPGDAGDREHITLLDRPLGDGRRRLRGHVDPTSGDCPTVRRLLRRDIDHPGPPERVEMGKAMVGHVSPRSHSCCAEDG